MRARLRPRHRLILCGVVVAAAGCVCVALVARSGFLGVAPQPPVTVLKVIKEDGFHEGTAFRVDAGWVTARHVLEGALLASLDQPSGDGAYVTTILADDPLHDVVVFEIEGSSSGTAHAFPVASDNAAAPHVGSPMRIARPQMKSVEVSLERIQVIPPYGLMLVLSAAGEPGWSGSPVLTESGEVIAVIRELRGDGLYASPIKSAFGEGSAAGSIDEWSRRPQPRPVMARTAFARAANAERDGDMDAALAGYAEAISLEDGYAWAKIRRAGIFTELHRFADAAAELTEALTTGAQDPELHLRRMVVAGEMRDCDTLTDSFRHLQSIFPDRSEMSLMYAQSALKCGCVDEAISVLQPLRQAPDPSDLGVLLVAEALIRSGDAVAALDLLKKHNLDLPRAKFLQVIAAVIGHGGEGVGSVQEFLQPLTRVSSRAYRLAQEVAAIDVAPAMCARLSEVMGPPWSSPEAAHLRGEIQRLAGDNDGALLSFNAALELAPGFWPSQGQLARVEAENGRLEAAIAHAESAVSLSGGDIDARLNLAQQLVEAGLYDRADAQARAAIEKDDRFARSWEILSRSALRQGRTDEAKAHFLKAVSIDASDLPVRRKYAKMLMAAKDYQAAVQEFADLKAASPDDSEAAILLAEALLDSGDRDAARTAAEDAAKLMVADDLPSLRRVVRVLCSTGEDDVARALVNRLGLEDRLARQILVDSGCTE